MQQNKPIIESIREYIMGCPLLEGKTVHIDYAGSTDEYSVKAVGKELVYKKYTDGTVLKQYSFILASKMSRGTEVDAGIGGNGFYQKFEEWVESNNENDVYPVLDNHIPVRVDVITNGHLAAADAELSEYQIQCNLIYR